MNKEESKRARDAPLRNWSIERFFLHRFSCTKKHKSFLLYLKGRIQLEAWLRIWRRKTSVPSDDLFISVLVDRAQFSKQSNDRRNYPFPMSVVKKMSDENIKFFLWRRYARRWQKITVRDHKRKDLIQLVGHRFILEKWERFVWRDDEWEVRRDNTFSLFLILLMWESHMWEFRVAKVHHVQWKEWRIL